MKKILSAIMCLVLLAGASVTTWAQTTRGRYTNRAAQSRRYDESRRSYANRYDQRHEDRSFWEEHRDKLTVAGGAGAGAVIGGLAGGKTGAVIGALLGAGGSALYTYGIRDRDTDRNYRRR